MADNLDPSLILAATRGPAYEPLEAAQMRTAQVAQARQNLQAGAQGMQIGAQDLQTKTYANQETATQLSEQQAIMQAVKAESARAAGPLPVPATAATPGMTPAGTPTGAAAPSLVPDGSGLVDRTGATPPIAAAATAAPAAAPALPAASPAPFSMDNVLNSVRGQIRPSTMLAMQGQVQASKQKLADFQKTQGEITAQAEKLNDDKNDEASQQALLVQKNGYSLPSIEVMAQHLTLAGHPDVANQLRALVAQNPDNAKPVIDAIAAGSTATMQTAQARAVTAATGAEKQATDLPIQQANAAQATRLNTAQQLLAAPNADAYYAQYSGIDKTQRALLPDFDDPDRVAKLRQYALTPEQQTTAAATAARDANTAKNEAGHLGIAAGELGIRQRTFNATLGSGLDANGHPLAPDELKAIAMRDPTAVAMANYQIPDPIGRTSALAKTTMAHVLAIDPNHDGTQFTLRNKTQQDFGPAGKTGQAITSTDTALAHLDTLSQAGRAMQNGDYKALNSLANSIGANIGRSPQNTYDTILSMVSPEISKAVIGGVGGEADRKNIYDRFNSSLSTPVREAAIGSAVSLLGARYDKQGEAYKSAMGKDMPRQLSPESQAVRRRYVGAAPAAPKTNPYR